MSFSQQVKKEICERQIYGPDRATAACYGVACFGRYFDTRGIVLHTERAYIAQWAKSVFQLAGIKGKVFVRGREKANRYEFAVKDPFEVEKMLALFGHSGDETAIRIHRDILEYEGGFSNFTAAAFLCCGMVVTPEKGYSLEFVSSRYQLIRDFEEILNQHNFTPKRSVRKGSNLLYFRASEQIEDLLTTMGAPQSALEIMNLKIYKDFRNKANRITNCETANIDKIVAATAQTMGAIKILEQQGVMETLPEALQSAARLRKENPDLSLAELAALAPLPLSKSGLSHRYRKLCQKAEEIQEIINRKDLPHAK